MSPRPDDVWEFRTIIPTDSLDTLHYHFYAMDNSSNQVTTSTKDVNVVDNDAPEFDDDFTSPIATTGEQLTFSLIVNDNIGVVLTEVEYWFGNAGVHTRTSMDQGNGGLWSHTIIVPLDSQDILHYIFRAEDASPLRQRTSIKDVLIQDNDPPTLSYDYTSPSATTGDELVFVPYMTDNIQISLVMVDYWYGDGGDHTSLPLTHVSGEIWHISIIVPLDSLESLHYFFYAEDHALNNITTGPRQVTVVDNDRPEILYEQSVGKALKGMPLELTVEAMDNIGVEGIYFVYRYGDRAVKNKSMGSSLSTELTPPRHPDGILQFHFSVHDAAGNWNSTGEYSIVLVNSVPSVSEIPTWSITEEAEAFLDLEPFLSDANDGITGLTVDCTDGTITVESLILNARYGEAVPDWTVTLTVSDGEDSTAFNVRIHIVNVNDLPVITEVLPVTGTVFKKGQTIIFSAEVADEDGDELTIMWWDGVTVLGTGSPFEHTKLGKGEHNITVVVDDGTDLTEESLLIRVTKEEESPGLGIFGTLLAILVVSVGRFSKKRYRRWDT
jgi:hypothetical protein